MIDQTYMNPSPGDKCSKVTTVMVPAPGFFRATKKGNFSGFTGFARPYLTLSHPRVWHPKGVRAIAFVGIKRVGVLVNSGGGGVGSRSDTWRKFWRGVSQWQKAQRIHRICALCQGVKLGALCLAQTGSHAPTTRMIFLGVTLFVCHLFTPLCNRLWLGSALEQANL